MLGLIKRKNPMKNLILIFILVASFQAVANTLTLDTPVAVSTDTVATYKITHFEVEKESKAFTIIYEGLSSGGSTLTSGVLSLTPAEYDTIMGTSVSTTLDAEIETLVYNSLKSKLSVTGTME